MTTTDHDTCRTYAVWLGRTPEEDGMGETSVWEPWQPEIGQRVRVTLGGECRIVGEAGSGMDEVGVTGCPPEFDGLCGTVRSVDGWQDREPLGGHRIHVLFDAPIRWRGFTVKGDMFAVAELIPLDDARQQQRQDGGA